MIETTTPPTYEVARLNDRIEFLRLLVAEKSSLEDVSRFDRSAEMAIETFMSTGINQTPNIFLVDTATDGVQGQVVNLRWVKYFNGQDREHRYRCLDVTFHASPDRIEFYTFDSVVGEVTYEQDVSYPTLKGAGAILADAWLTWVA